MGADLHIHVIRPYFTEEDYKVFSSNNLGSKYCGYATEERRKSYDTLFMDCKSTPSVWVGSVSWLKAALFVDAESYIPDPVVEVYEVIGEDFPVIDDQLIEKVRKAFNLPNKTKKEGGVFNGEGYPLADAERVIKFLENHKGEKAFTISW